MSAAMAAGGVTVRSAGEPRRRRIELHVRGVVQGVGFRPFVHRLAVRHALSGWVRNESGEVCIALEGDETEIAAFVSELRREAPPLARIDALEMEPREPDGTEGFAIALSGASPDRRLPISPDVGLCAACETELYDPANRRYRYPFITCTDCGPRFTVIEDMPYDRERTSMRAFTQCAACLDEYRNPVDRRYHSQTNACAACGPRVALLSPGGAGSALDEAALREAADRLRSGGIVAIRGLGGFHLAVDATNVDAIDRLRERKGREAKPLAVMVRRLDEARALAHVDAREADLLQSRERPIVLLRRRSICALAPGVAPGLGTVGVMLAYTPLHHLLLDAVSRPLVMTSGNHSDEPIATGNGEALRRLDGIADAFLVHDREIVARHDDSLLRVVDGAPVFLRRARGYAPLPVRLPIAAPQGIVAVARI
jgi:hydrogenase maturation protein HypF